jgi:hypothetical protein
MLFHHQPHTTLIIFLNFKKLLLLTSLVDNFRQINRIFHGSHCVEREALTMFLRNLELELNFRVHSASVT